MNARSFMPRLLLALCAVIAASLITPAWAQGPLRVGSTVERTLRIDGKRLTLPMGAWTVAADGASEWNDTNLGAYGYLRTVILFRVVDGKLDTVLEETARVFTELGWPAMVTPFSQLVATQAVLNVVGGERYRTVPNEIKKYALGYYGKPLAPVQPDVLDRIISNGSSHIALTPVPLEPAVPAMRKKYPNMSDEERLLRHLYAGTQVDDMLAAGPMRTDYSFDKPIVHLLKELAKRPRVGRIYVEKGNMRLEMKGNWTP